jgi:hypothetical protein
MLTVVWDVDDILNDLMYQWFAHGWLAEHPDCLISYKELTSNPPHMVLGIDRSDYLISMDRFRKTQRGCNLSPNPEVLTWFREQGHRLRHIALTARPLETAPDVAHWVLKYFGAWIRCFGVVPSRAEVGIPVYDRTKGEYLAWLGRGNILVDDANENIAQAASLGLRTLQPAQPWNASNLTLPALLQELSQMAGES